MQKRIIHDDILDEIIKFTIDWRTDDIGNDTTLGQIHGTLNMVDWMFEHLRSKFPSMKPLDDERRSSLVNGNTLDDLANIAMTLLPDGATMETDDGDDKTKDEEPKKVVGFCLCNNIEGGDSISSMNEDQPMTRQEFLNHCAEFYDARGTHLNDFEMMHIRIA